MSVRSGEHFEKRARELRQSPNIVEGIIAHANPQSEEAMKEFHILNLAAGVPSTTLHLMFTARRFATPQIDYAIFADTGEEPKPLYRHWNAP